MIWRTPRIKANRHHSMADIALLPQSATPVSAPSAAASATSVLRNKLAFFYRSRLIITSIFLCAVIAITLASSRFGFHLKSFVAGSRSLANRVQLPIPLYTKPDISGSRPVTTSTMAPPQYKKPPQVPPVFTATAESLLSDTRRLVSAHQAYPTTSNTASHGS